ncbi:MAG: BolA family protein [Gammaproteobacteria bacterium]
MTLAEERIGKIRKYLENRFHITHLQIVDDGHKHHGHSTANGGGHFTVQIVADEFSGKSLVQRHQMVYTTLTTLMENDIHALSIKAYDPNEFKSRGN